MKNNKNTCLIDSKVLEFDAVSETPNAYPNKKLLGKGVYLTLQGVEYNDNGKEHYFFIRKK